MSIVIIVSTELELESSGEESGSEVATEESNTTSWEDMSKLDPNLLLYKAAEARNLPVMSEALANGANPNWVNNEDNDKTPIMKAIETVKNSHLYLHLENKHMG